MLGKGGTKAGRQAQRLEPSWCGTRSGLNGHHDTEVLALAGCGFVDEESRRLMRTKQGLELGGESTGLQLQGQAV